MSFRAVGAGYFHDPEKLAHERKTCNILGYSSRDCKYCCIVVCDVVELPKDVQNCRRNLMSLSSGKRSEHGGSFSFYWTTQR